jgi:hypothetical protein
MTKRFRDKLTIYVFTLRCIVLDKMPITYVSHDAEGDWQFLRQDRELREEDAMLISLGEMIEHDPSILEIADLPRGGFATRRDENSPWRIGRA